MGIILQKGQKTDITKSNPGLKTVIVGLGWDTKSYKGVEQFDIDASAFVLERSGKVASDDDFVFYNNNNWGNGAVIHSGDSKVGSGIGDDEQIKLELCKIPQRIEKVAFTCTIYDYEKRNQTFGQVKDAYIRVVNGDTNEEIARFNLGDSFAVETAIVFGEIYRHNGEWKFNPIGS